MSCLLFRPHACFTNRSCKQPGLLADQALVPGRSVFAGEHA